MGNWGSLAPGSHGSAARCGCTVIYRAPPAGSGAVRNRTRRRQASPAPGSPAALFASRPLAFAPGWAAQPWIASRAPLGRTFSYSSRIPAGPPASVPVPSVSSGEADGGNPSFDRTVKPSRRARPVQPDSSRPGQARAGPPSAGPGPVQARPPVGGSRVSPRRTRPSPPGLPQARLAPLVRDNRRASQSSRRRALPPNPRRPAASPAQYRPERLASGAQAPLPP